MLLCIATCVWYVFLLGLPSSCVPNSREGYWHERRSIDIAFLSFLLLFAFPSVHCFFRCWYCIPRNLLGGNAADSWGQRQEMRNWCTTPSSFFSLLNHFSLFRVRSLYIYVSTCQSRARWNCFNCASLSFCNAWLLYFVVQLLPNRHADFGQADLLWNDRRGTRCISICI